MENIYVAKPILGSHTYFESNRERKARQRITYRSLYGGRGARWMKHGVVPPRRGGHGRTVSS